MITSKRKRKRTSPIWKLPKGELQKLVQTSETMTQVLDFFGMNNGGGNHRTLIKRLEEEDIDYSKFKGNFGRGGFKKPIPLENILVEGSGYTRRHLKNRLLKEGLLEDKCDICGLGNEWQGEKLVMVLDHINGVNNDNRIGNLRLLCPNCNSQQDTFCGKHRRTIINNCLDCGKSISKNAQRCKRCTSLRQPRKVPNRPDKEDLRKEIAKTSYCAAGKKYGVSDNTIRKWLSV